MRLLLVIISSIIYLNGNIKIFSEDIPPFAYNNKLNKPSGIAVEVINKILSNLNESTNIKIINFNKAFHIVKNSDNSILFPVTRTKKREKLFKWVGPLFVSSSYLYKLKEDKNIYNEKNIKNIKRIAVVRNYASTRYLIDKKYNNLFFSSHTSQSIRLLVNKKVQLADIGEIFMPFRSKQAKINYRLLENTGIKTLVHKQYIAFSRNTPDHIINKWQKELNSIKKSQLYKKILENEYKKALKRFDII